MALPLLPLLKIIALGFIKVVFLLLGTVFFPIYALRLILTGAAGMLLPVLDWLEHNGRLEAERHQAIVDDLAALSAVDFTRSEARHLLIVLIKKTVSNMGQALLGIPRILANYFRRWFGST